MKHIEHEVFWHSGALITARKEGYDIILAKNLWVYRDTLRKAKWVSTVYKNVVKRTYANELDSSFEVDSSGGYFSRSSGNASVGQAIQ